MGGQARIGGIRAMLRSALAMLASKPLVALALLIAAAACGGKTEVDASSFEAGAGGAAGLSSAESPTGGQSMSARETGLSEDCPGGNLSPTG
jgi:hypothetical protein